MPRKVPTPCVTPGCPNVSVGPRCKTCLPKYLASRPKRKRGPRTYPRGRASATARGYGEKWRLVRGRYLALHRSCERCGAPAREVHHVKPKREGGTDRFENLEALCKSCHNQTIQDEKRTRKLDANLRKRWAIADAHEPQKKKE